MSLFSFFSKNKQESKPGEREFYSRAEEDSHVVRGRGTRRQGGAANQSVDPVLPEKKRARRRLVGAVALVLAVVIGLPMILDSEPKQQTDNIAIQIPSKDKPPQADAGAGVLPATPAMPAAPAASVPVAESLGQREQVILVPNAKEDAIAASPKATAPAQPVAAAAMHGAQGAEDAAGSKTKEGAKPIEPSHAAQKADAKPAKVEQRASEKRGDARAEAILEGKDVDSHKPNADKKPVRFVVQVAAFASQDKVSELQGKLSDAGIKSYTQKVPTASGERIRVRIGPFASKNEADGARAKLSKLGLNGTLVPS
jgi:DedD protein